MSEQMMKVTMMRMHAGLAAPLELPVRRVSSA